MRKSTIVMYQIATVLLVIVAVLLLNEKKEKRMLERKYNALEAQSTWKEERVSIEEFTSAYRINPARAVRRFSALRLTVEGGYVHTIGRDAEDRMHLMLAAQGDEFGLDPVRCQLKNPEEAHIVNIDTVVDVRGVVLGQSHLSAQLDQCELVTWEP